MPKLGRVPGCTHIDVTRSYVPHEQCHLCSLASPLGFLYECQQECDRTTLREMIVQQNGKSMIRKSELRQQLECVGLSESVIETAELGHYTESQLELLHMQKADLRQAIQDSLERSQISSTVAKWTAMLPGPSNHDGTVGSKIFSDKSPPICGLKACHYCRPYFINRIPISIQGVLQGDFYPMTHKDIALLPVKSSRFLRAIGLHQSTRNTMPLRMTTSIVDTTKSAPATASTSCSESSNLIFHTTQSDLDGINIEHSSRRLFYKSSRRLLSFSSEGTVERLGTRKGWRATGQRWIRSHRPSKSADSKFVEDVHDNLGLPKQEIRQALRETAANLHLDGIDRERWFVQRQDSQMSLRPCSSQRKETLSPWVTACEPDKDSSVSSDELSVNTPASYNDSLTSDDTSDGTLIQNNVAVHVATQVRQGRQHRESSANEPRI